MTRQARPVAEWRRRRTAATVLEWAVRGILAVLLVSGFYALSLVVLVVLGA